MIIYSCDKSDFIAKQETIPDILKVNVLERLGEETSDNEYLSWKNSLAFMRRLLETSTIPDDAGIALEYNIPVTNNRIDFIVTGYDDIGRSQVVVIELKQWSSAEKTDMDGVVRTRYEDGLKETTHPSYQAFTYCMLLQDYKEAVQKHIVKLKAAAYLHNCEDTSPLKDPFYEHYTRYVPVYGKNDTDELRLFLSKYIRKGDRQKGIFVIENSQIRPSKNLMDSVASMMKGNREFRMIGEQQVVLQHILKAMDVYEQTLQKQVLIIKGGPGTGKSVIAVNALSEVIKKGKVAMYVSKNAQPRKVFYRKLVDGGLGSKNVNALFKSSDTFAYAKPNEFDMLLVDEAHRLSRKGGQYSHSVNQVKETVNAAKVTVFFIDEAQRVSLEDIGSIQEITLWAERLQAKVSTFEMKAQFRCAGSDEYLMWLDDLLQIRPSNFKLLGKENYDFRVMDNPREMMSEIRKNNRRNKSRMVAGYCWEWVSRKDTTKKDIVFPEYKFAYQWNLLSDQTWSITPGSVNQIGCIHTCQGLEFDYVGVIIGPDIIYRDGKILVDPSKRAKDDFTIHGYKKMMNSDPEGTKEIVRQIIKNTYRTLMSRGMKGCFVYVMDEELRNYIKSRIR